MPYEVLEQAEIRRAREHLARARRALSEGKAGIAKDRIRKARLCEGRAALWNRRTGKGIEQALMDIVANRIVQDMEDILLG